MATGFCPAKNANEQAKALGIDLDPFSFVQTDYFNPVSTSRPGVYACGMALGPQDIPGSLVQASAASCLANKHLAPARTLKQERASSDGIGTDADEPRVGVFFSDFGQVIKNALDLDAVKKAVSGLEGVAYVTEIEISSGREGLAELEKDIVEHHLNRVVVAGYSPRTHGKIFAEAIKRAGLNRAMLEMANLRDQDALVHRGNPAAATAKAIDLVRTAVAGVCHAKPIHAITLPFNPDALVVGGGVAGMSAALGMADQGGNVYLIERDAQLGGVGNKVVHTLEGELVAPHVEQLVKKVQEHPKIQVLTNSLVVDHKGQVGDFVTGVQSGPGMFYRQIKHGVTILATGAMWYEPSEYLYGQEPRVMTQLDMERLLNQPDCDEDLLDTVVMIQCVGSRNEKNPACGRICCRSAVQNALLIKERKPEARVFVLYRDMRIALQVRGSLPPGPERGRDLCALRSRESAPGAKKSRQPGSDLQGPCAGQVVIGGAHLPGAFGPPTGGRREHRRALRDIPPANRDPAAFCWRSTPRCSRWTPRRPAYSRPDRSWLRPRCPRPAPRAYPRPDAPLPWSPSWRWCWILRWPRSYRSVAPPALSACGPALTRFPT